MNLVAKKLGIMIMAVTASTIIPEFAIAANLAYGETAVKEIEYLANNLAGRSVGTAKEAETVDYLSQRLGDLGYKPNLQEFTYDFSGQTLS